MEHNFYSILSEDSRFHWEFFDASNKNVLDLGCGRHQTSGLENHSPTYFALKGANKVVGVDISQGEIDYYNHSVASSDFYRSKTTFICTKIDGPEIVLSLIKEYDIDAVKCDIEGYETSFYTITRDDLSGVKEIAIEYHEMDIREAILNKFSEWGFNIVVEGKFGFVSAPQMGVLFGRK